MDNVPTTQASPDEIAQAQSLLKQCSFIPAPLNFLCETIIASKDKAAINSLTTQLQNRLTEHQNNYQQFKQDLISIAKNKNPNVFKAA